MPEHILISEPRDAVVTITLNRPAKKNALSIALRDDVSDALDAIVRDEHVKAVILTGAGDVFSAGFDLSEFQTAAQDAAFHKKLWASSDRFHHACINFPLPLIAAVNGAAIAGGFDLATMCDIRLASENAKFSHPEITFGPVIYSLLHDLVGGAVARELCLMGREVMAEEALALRLVSKVVPRERLDDETRALVALITRSPREVILGTKKKIIARAGIAKAGTLQL
jgi:enoyl-CoA hydratase/carnithine racemase